MKALHRWQVAVLALLFTIFLSLSYAILYRVVSSIRQPLPSAEKLKDPDSTLKTVETSDPGITPTPLRVTEQPRPLKFTTLPAFQVETVVSHHEVDPRISLALDSYGEPWVAYFDASSNNLKLATRMSGAWNIQDLEDATGCHSEPVLAIDAQNEPAILCTGRGNGGLVFARRQSNLLWLAWMVMPDVKAAGIALVFDGMDRAHGVFVDRQVNMVYYAVEEQDRWKTMEVGTAAGKESGEGPQVALAVDSQNQPHILYTSTDQTLRMASLAGSKDRFVSVELEGHKGRSLSLATRSDGKIFTSFVDPATQELKFAAVKDNRLEEMAKLVDRGEYPSLAFDSQGLAHLSYFDPAGHGLSYAAQDGRGGWTRTSIDGTYGVGPFSSLAINPSGRVVISYAVETDQQILLASQLDTLPGASAHLEALHHSGQTFLTWPERRDLSGEVYKIYRSSQPLQPDFPAGWKLLGQVGKSSALFYANRYSDDGLTSWHNRYLERLVVPGAQKPVPPDTGLFVWTQSADDFAGQAQGEGYYAVTVTAPGMDELLLASSTQAVEEKLQDPLPVEITKFSDVKTGEGGHVYIQYMDLSDWNPTFHAPNPTNLYYGFDPQDPFIKNALAYAYDYTVFVPTPAVCGGKVPETLPVLVNLHGFRSNRYSPYDMNWLPMCGYEIYPIDETETWYFGFAKYHDFRPGGEIQPKAGGQVERIENFTEQRVLRMVYDLLRQPPNSGGPRPDPQRVYVFGHSMGGSGALAFAERYPNVFAAAYSSHPMTNFPTAGNTHVDWAADVTKKWGSQALNLPVLIRAPNGWSQHLLQSSGQGVWDWQNFLNFPMEDMVPLGIDQGVPDHVIHWETQGEPLFPALDAARQAWGGAATDQDHEWSAFKALPASLKYLGSPFWNLEVVRNESVPGLSRSSGNYAFPAEQGDEYYQTIKWSSSWDPWDGPPSDRVDEWQISLCAVKPGSTHCGSGRQQTVDVTPRRLQTFQVNPGGAYTWENIDIATGKIIASGSVSADAQGLLLIADFWVNPTGNRLLVRKK